MYQMICYFYITPVLKSHCIRHGYNVLYKKGYKIKIYELSPVLNPVAYNSVKKDLLEDERFRVNTLYTKEEIIEAIRKLPSKKVIAIPYFDFNLDYYFVYKELSKCRIDVTLLHRVNTEARIPGINRNRINQYFRNISMHNVRNSLFIRIPKKLIPIKKAKYMILGGRENFEEYVNVNLVDRKTKFVNIHALNFEDCISCKDDRLIDGDYAVFLDQYMPFHPDHIDIGIKINADQYYGELEKLFDVIQKTYGYKIIIAAHPKADYDTNLYFEKYEKIKFKTVPLIRDCKLVIANFTTALSYVAFFKKKLIICDSSCFKDYDYFNRRVVYWSQELGIAPLNLSDNDIDVSFIREKVESPIDLNLYKKCIQDTMKRDFKWKRKYVGFWNEFENKVLRGDLENEQK